MSDKKYDEAQVCPNGHVANGYSTTSPAFNKNFCETCGQETITACLECQHPIRGGYLGGALGFTYEPPAYCLNCGAAFPWTQAKLQAAHELVQQFGLSDEDRALLEKSIDDLVEDTPATIVAVERVKKIMVKAGEQAMPLLSQALKTAVSEATKELLGW